jgi:regulator of sigma E protease
MNVILGFLLMFVYVLISGADSVASTQIAGFHVHYTGDTAQLGFEPGDYLHAFVEGEEGIRIRSYDQVYQKALEANGAPTDIYVQRASEDGMSFSYVLIEDVTLDVALVESLFEGSVSEKTGLKQQDVVKKVNGTRVHTYHELAYEIMNQGYRPLNLTVLRGEEEIVLEGVTFPNYTESGATFGNVDFLIYAEEDFGILTILKHTWFRSCSTVKMVYDSLFGLFTNRFGVEAVSGPIGITKTISTVARQSMLNVLYLVVVISINLGIMNLLPFPGLDGGHLMIYAIEVVRRKPMKRELEGAINFVGLVILLALAALIMIKDILTL